MPVHPPPATDWVLGDDGHWRPPPFSAGGQPHPAPGAAVPPQPVRPGWSGSDASQPYAAPGGAPRRGGAGPIIIGLAVAGVAVVALLVGAVTFLGTTPDETSADSGLTLADDDQRADTAAPTDPPATAAAPDAPAPTTPPAAPAVTAEATALAAVTRLETGGDWLVTGSEVPDPDVVGTCAVDGWLTGAADRFYAYIGRPSTGEPEALTLALTTYVDDAAAEADHQRVRSQQYLDCEAQERLAETTGSSTDATVTVLPDDPLAPGVTLQVDLVGGPDPLTEFEFTIVVGRQRAHLDFCGCADLGMDGQREVARQVAAAMAEAQGLDALG